MGVQAASVRLPISLDCVSAIARRIVIVLGGSFSVPGSHLLLARAKTGPVLGKWVASGRLDGQKPTVVARIGCSGVRDHATPGESGLAHGQPVYEGRSWEESSAVGDANDCDGCRSRGSTA